MKPHYNLDAWQEARKLVKIVYDITKTFPADELYGLTSQIRRCVISIASNIAEGAARGSKPDFARFLAIALGSLAELETQLILAVDLEYMGKEHGVFHQIGTVSKLLTGLRRSVKG